MLERRLRCIASNNQPKFRGVIDKENNTWPVTGFLISEWLNCCSVETSRSSRDRKEYLTIIVKTSVGRCCPCLKIGTSLQPLECLCLMMMMMMIPLLKCQNLKNKSINELIKIKKNYVQYKQVRNSRDNNYNNIHSSYHKQ